MTKMTDPRTDEPDDDQRPMASVLMAGLPITRLDPIRRLHVLAAAIPGAVVREQLIPAPFATVWEEISDLERAVPASEWHVRSLRITERHGERLTADVENVIGLHDEFAIVLRPGWCGMEGRLLFAGMAAVADPAGTRLAWRGHCYGAVWTAHCAGPRTR